MSLLTGKERECDLFYEFYVKIWTEKHPFDSLVLVQFLSPLICAINVITHNNLL